MIRDLFRKKSFLERCFTRVRVRARVYRLRPKHGNWKITDTFEILLFANEPADGSEFAFGCLSDLKASVFNVAVLFFFNLFCIGFHLNAFCDVIKLSLCTPWPQAREQLTHLVS